MVIDWSSLIPVGSALLGGLIGFSGALVASRRATKTAFEQVRYSRLQERQFDAIATLYGYAHRLYIDVNQVQSATTKKTVFERSMESSQIFIRANHFLRENMLWLRPEETSLLATFLMEAFYRRKELTDAALELSLSSPEYQQKKRAAESWFLGKGNEMLAELHVKRSEMLGLHQWSKDTR